MVAINSSTPGQHIENTPESDTTLTIPVDAEHGGIRAAGCGLTLVSTIVSFIVLSLLLPEAIILILLASLFIGAGSSYASDKFLKDRWPSGRELHATDETISLTKHGKIESVINTEKHTQFLSWRFKIKRSGRVKKGWYVVALALEQDPAVIPVYTFMSPDNFEEMNLPGDYTPLEKPDKPDRKARKGGYDMRLSGKQRRLHEAEQLRYLTGAEVTPQQFKLFADHIQKHHPSWISG